MVQPSGPLSSLMGRPRPPAARAARTSWRPSELHPGRRGRATCAAWASSPGSTSAVGAQWWLGLGTTLALGAASVPPWRHPETPPLRHGCFCTRRPFCMRPSLGRGKPSALPGPRPCCGVASGRERRGTGPWTWRRTTLGKEPLWTWRTQVRTSPRRATPGRSGPLTAPRARLLQRLRPTFRLPRRSAGRVSNLETPSGGALSGAVPGPQVLSRAHCSVRPPGASGLSPPGSGGLDPDRSAGHSTRPSGTSYAVAHAGAIGPSSGPPAGGKCDRRRGV